MRKKDYRRNDDKKLFEVSGASPSFLSPSDEMTEV
jgi:hypothetical protein